jgi:dTDP-glucose pyrophosphorylase
MKSTLVIMAAGMGSRYGGLKQLESVGPNGEAIIDYSVYDAAKAGFDHIVFIVREEIVPDFNSFLKNRYPKKIKIQLALQKNPTVINSGRTKPWGTAHAVLAAETSVNNPFAIINADDFYGRDAFEKAHDFLNQSNLKNHTQGLIAYRLADTLSPHGTVSRGVCTMDKIRKLLSIQEILNIGVNKEEGIYYIDESEQTKFIEGDTLVSMNFWCLQPEIFKHFKQGFERFLSKNKSSLKTEYLIPTMINQLIESNRISVKVESTIGPWFGITYKEDKAGVCDSILKLTQSGTYPSPLWK